MTSYAVGTDMAENGDLACAMLMRVADGCVVAKIGPERGDDGKLLVTRYEDDVPSDLLDDITIYIEA